jgi:hypothetical protein
MVLTLIVSLIALAAVVLVGILGHLIDKNAEPVPQTPERNA